MDAHPDTVDLGEIVTALRKGWRHVLAGVAVGLLAAAVGLLVLRRQFEGTATVLLRSTQPGGGSLASRMGLPTDLLPATLSTSLSSPLETEIAILSSRAVTGQVVDSLGLQARILTPAGTPSDAALVPAVYPGSFEPLTYRFERTGDGRSFLVRGSGVQANASPGQAVRLPVGTVTLRSDGLPPSFTVRFLDREDAITRTARHMKVGKSSGEIAQVTFRADDSLTAAAAPNAAIALYLERRRTTDRGTNQRRLEFLLGYADTVARRLTEAEHRLRLFEEASGVLDPELMGRAIVERGTALRQQLEQVEVEAAALNQMIARAAAGSLTTRQLAAFPTFLKSPAINDLLSQMATLETERLKLVEHRTDRDPEVQALVASIRNLEGQLTPLATAYSGALARQSEEITAQLDSVHATLAALPGQTETSLQLQRDTKQLGQTFVALQTQVVEARLAAITEGGDVRQIDLAQPPKRPAFPRPLTTILIGLSAGLLLGLLAALKAAYLGRWIGTAEEVERAAGCAGIVLDPAAPLLIGGLAGYHTILVVPLGRDANPGAVARRLASTVAERETTVAVTAPSTRNATGGGSIRPEIRRLESDHSLVIAAVPPLDDPRTAALLDQTTPVLFVARAGRLARRELVAAVATLRRLGIPCSGVVLHGSEADGDLPG